MIVRILGEGQFELQDSQVASLEELDQKLVAALDASDEPTFRDVLTPTGPKCAIGRNASSHGPFRAFRTDAAERDRVPRRAP